MDQSSDKNKYRLIYQQRKLKTIAQTRKTAIDLIKMKLYHSYIYANTYWNKNDYPYFT